MRILGIETSCDETAAAVVEFGNPSMQAPSKRGLWSGNIDANILSNFVHSQIATHRKTGGVVPEVAAREHAEKIVPLIEAVVEKLSARAYRLKPDIIAVTYGPGLITSLMVGVEAARTLSWLWRVPIVAVNHIAGHIAIASLQPVVSSQGGMTKRSRRGLFRPARNDDPTHYSLRTTHYPALALVVSGGHTELVLMKKLLQYHIIGATRDDAVGEAFDKVAKILGLQYPGGPIVSKLAERGDPEIFPFSPPMIKSPDYDFSFSGIKTAVLYKVRESGITNNESWPRSSLRVNRSNPRHLGRGQDPSDSSQVPQCAGSRCGGVRMTMIDRNNLCASFQRAVVEVLVAKTIRAAKEYKAKTIILAGGVAANKQLRTQLAKAIQQHIPTSNFLLPTSTFCTDNAVMIAAAGYFQALKKQFTPWQTLDVNPNAVIGI